MSISETEPTNENTKIWVDPSQVVAEYVVEVGTKDGWRYRRYNTGFVEYWLRTVQKNVNIVTPWGNGIYDSGSTHYGSALYYPVPFTEIVNAQISISESDFEVVIGSTRSPSSPLVQPPQFYGVRGTGTSVAPTVTLNYYACGYITNLVGTIKDY